jgi:hypothetical protein
MNSDAYSTFQDTAETLAQGTTYSDVIKMDKSGDAYKQLKLYAQVKTAFTSGGSATVQFVLEKDDNEAFASKTDVLDSGALAVATLVDNYVIWDRYLEDLTWQETAAGAVTWLRVKKVVATADLTAGLAKIELTGIRPKNLT